MITCLHCGVALVRRRRQTKFCTDRCRANHRRAQQAREVAAILDASSDQHAARAIRKILRIPWIP